MGMGASNVLDRVAASMGDLIAVEPVFQTVADVPHGGVLLALPALLAVGLLHHAHKYFQLPKGYYGLESLFLILAFLALARLPSLEQLRYCAPGEWGKLLGLEHEIVPRLEKEIPNQPTPEQLEADPKLHRFILVFDREGYSPVFLRSLKKKECNPPSAHDEIIMRPYSKRRNDDWLPLVSINEAFLAGYETQ